MAFTGPSDAVAWVLWYEKDQSRLGLRNNEQVLAAKLVADPNADGGFHWQAVGRGTAGPPVQLNPLDTSGANGFGPCAASVAAEDARSLNANPAHDAARRGQPLRAVGRWCADLEPPPGRHQPRYHVLRQRPIAAVNAPFLLFTTAGSPQRLFSQAIVGGSTARCSPGAR